VPDTGPVTEVGRLESALQGYQRAHGTAATVAVVTAFGSVTSVLLCCLVYAFTGFPRGVEGALIGLGLPLLVPVIAAPPGLLVLLRALRRSDDLLAEVTYLVSHDPLTEVLNRRGFLEAMAAPSPGWRLVVADVDDFKSVNDLLGHAAGDEVLQGVARQLAALVGPAAVVARFGGDEFVAAVPPDAVPDLGPLPPRLRVPLVRTAPREDVVWCSLGSADVGQGEALDQALARADLSLYATKRSKDVGELA
jgi:diguanylate cyclase (GGDEF)-like protein